MIGIAVNLHDHNTFDGSYHFKEERMNRFKHNFDGEIKGFEFMKKFFNNDQTVAFSTTMGGIRENPQFKGWLESDPEFYNQILTFDPKNLWEYITKENYYYADHHCAHAAYAYLSSGYEESDILAIDGLGIGTASCKFFNKSGDVTDLSDEVPLGRLWNIVTAHLGLGRLAEGKTMGLAAYGKYDKNIQNKLSFIFEDIYDKDNRKALEGLDYFDLAYNIQYFTNEIVKEFILPLKSSNNICIAGGVSYNGYMNELFTKEYGNVYVPPAPGDEGQGIAIYMHADYVLNENIKPPSVYSGLTYNVE